LRAILKSKIHRATVTETDINYVGSITIDEALLEKAEILEHEKVLIVNITTGSRFETYATAAPRNSRVVCINGGAARLALPGDKVIVMAFGLYDDAVAAHVESRVVFVDDRNAVADVFETATSRSEPWQS
jgi:aspartate 1-decarboxylase